MAPSSTILLYEESDRTVLHTPLDQFKHNNPFNTPGYTTTPGPPRTSIPPLCQHASSLGHLYLKVHYHLTDFHILYSQAGRDM